MKTLFPNFSDESAVRLFTACLPVLFFCSELGESARISAAVALNLIAAAVFFLSLGRFFPGFLRGTALVLWLAVSAHWMALYGIAHPSAAVSLYLLIPAGFLGDEGRLKVLRQALVRAFLFPVLLMTLGALREILGERLLLWTFRLPAGCFLLLAAAAFLWKNQPGRTSVKTQGRGDPHGA